MAVGGASALRVPYVKAGTAIATRILAIAPSMTIKETIALDVEDVPIEMFLGYRHRTGSKLIVRRHIGEFEESRLERVRRALADKCPKLARARQDGRTSILVLESHDPGLSNYAVVGRAVKQALGERDDLPDIVFVVESDAAPFYAWVIENRTTIRLEHCYEG